MKWTELKAMIEADAEEMGDCGNDKGWQGCLIFGLMIVILAALAMIILD